VTNRAVLESEDDRLLRCVPMRITRLAFVFSALALQLGCGGVTAPPPPPPPPLAPPPTVIRTLYRVVVNGADRMTTFGPNERGNYPLEGQVYYVPDQPGSDRTTLNRLISAGGADHADATETLNGYSMDQTIGYPWTNSSLPALAPILEELNSLTGDYAMLVPPENIPGYTSHSLPVYGYPRYGNAGEVLLSLSSAGGVTVESNAVAGGALWRWFWNGVQFVNNRAYGRQIQADFYYPASPNYNPTEAGDFYDRTDPILAHGSPLLRFENQGSTQITRAVPLNWDAAAVTPTIQSSGISSSLERT
jgi:hypothetical protein